MPKWALLEAVSATTGQHHRPRRQTGKHCRRTVLDAIFYLVRGGIAWRQLPAEFPPPMTVYAIFARWVGAGAWRRIPDTLRDRTPRSPSSATVG